MLKTTAAAAPRCRVREALDAYASLRERARGDDRDGRRRDQLALVDHFYDMVTDLYQLGWGASFHFAPRRRNESFEASIVRHERFLMEQLELDSSATVLDVGCGVGGPMREIATASGAAIVGLNHNAHQIAKGECLIREAGLAASCSFVSGDFQAIPFPGASFDAAYSIEATCHASDRVTAFTEVARVLKAGGSFAGYEWCLTERFRADDPEHQRVRRAIELGNALPELAPIHEVVAALEKAGFEDIEWRDLALESDPETPWYRPLAGRDRSLRSLSRTPLGCRLTAAAVRLLERMHLAPPGTAEVSRLLNRAADALVRGGEIGIFTPLLYFRARVPGAAGLRPTGVEQSVFGPVVSGAGYA